MSRVNRVGENTRAEEALNIFCYGRSHRRPVGLEETRREAVWPWGLIRVDGKHGFFDFLW